MNPIQILRSRILPIHRTQVPQTMETGRVRVHSYHSYLPCTHNNLQSQVCTEPTSPNQTSEDSPYKVDSKRPTD
ncbi:hypothetical protein BDQ94DRAFT_139272 [Aspergillus welwitschiae]|uniref:Uncharacterized protein n=1 Tax=Aspergillus welwitschiae TaxID=1341132 RepID=A0A3F3Q9N7_9EURO|nr:hypothetical protein BDQ94DRAFT_139272 [Aspergillus welwitschiae]RDH35797.1 hypothetical protein BDQ94DRAFT_139272 [Aspergillus welwitschiae]